MTKPLAPRCSTIAAVTLIYFTLFVKSDQVSNNDNNSADNTTSVRNPEVSDTDWGSTDETLVTSPSPTTPAPAAACDISLYTQVTHMALGCVGIWFNSVSLTMLTKSNKLRLPFRVILTSLSLVDISFALVTVVTASMAIAAIFFVDQDSDFETKRDLTITCNALTAVYHSLLGCSSTITVTLALDRLFAVFSPVRYRSRFYLTVFPSWGVVLVCLLAYPLTWRYLGGQLRDDLLDLSCWPLIAILDGCLISQAVLFLVSSLSVMSSYACVLFKLTRRAILVVPLFGPRTSDNTATERRQTRRNVIHCASQAMAFCLLYLPFAILLAYLAITDDRRQEACSVGFLLLSILPSLNNIMSPLLLIWRLCPRRFFPAICARHFSPTDSENNERTTQSQLQDRPTGVDAQPLPSTSFAGSRDTACIDASAKVSVPDGRSAGGSGSRKVTEESDRREIEGRESHDVNSDDIIEEDVDDADLRRTSTETQKAAEGWVPRRDNYNDDKCRANPGLLKRTKGRRGSHDVSEDDVFEEDVDDTDLRRTSTEIQMAAEEWVSRRDNYNDDKCRANPGLLTRTKGRWGSRDVNDDDLIEEVVDDAVLSVTSLETQKADEEWVPRRDNYNDDKCRANPGLLTRTNLSEERDDGADDILVACDDSAQVDFPLGSG